MRVFIKILLSIGILCGGSFIGTLIARSMGNNHSTGGIGPLIFYPAILAAIWAVWKYNPGSDQDEKDNHNLKKN